MAPQMIKLGHIDSSLMGLSMRCNILYKQAFIAQCFIFRIRGRDGTIYWFSNIFQYIGHVDLDIDLEIRFSQILILILILKSWYTKYWCWSWYWNKMKYWYQYWYWYREKTAKISKMGRLEKRQMIICF